MAIRAGPRATASPALPGSIPGADSVPFTPSPEPLTLSIPIFYPLEFREWRTKDTG